MPNQNQGGFQGQQDKNTNQVKDSPQVNAGLNAGQKNDQNKKNANPQGTGGQWNDKKNLSGSDSDSE